MSNVVSLDQRRVRPNECLYCHLTRMLEVKGCDHTLKLTGRWIDAQRRSARWVINWADRLGGGCDCEMLFSVFRDDKRGARHRKLRCAPSYETSVSQIEACRGVDA